MQLEAAKGPDVELLEATGYSTLKLFQLLFCPCAPSDRHSSPPTMTSTSVAAVPKEKCKEDKKSIVFFHPDLGIGGAERLVIDAAVGLQELGHKVTIFTSYCDKNHCFEEARDGESHLKTP